MNPRCFLPKVGERVATRNGECATVCYGSYRPEFGGDTVPINLDGREGIFWYAPRELRPLEHASAFAKTIEYVEAQADEVSGRALDPWTVAKRHSWIVNRLAGMHHWQALEAYLGLHPAPDATHEEPAA